MLKRGVDIERKKTEDKQWRKRFKFIYLWFTCSAVDVEDHTAYPICSGRLEISHRPRRGTSGTSESVTLLKKEQGCSTVHVEIFLLPFPPSFVHAHKLEP